MMRRRVGIIKREILLLPLSRGGRARSNDDVSCCDRASGAMIVQGAWLGAEMVRRLPWRVHQHHPTAVTSKSPPA